MPHIIDGTTYLTTTESHKHLGWSYQTFQKYAEGTLQRHTFPGKNSVYYRLEDLQQFLLPIGQEPLEKRLADVARSVLRNTPMEELPPEWKKLKQEVEAETANLV